MDEIFVKGGGAAAGSRTGGEAQSTRDVLRRGIGREEVAQEAARGAKEALREEVDAAISSGELRGERGERGEKGDDGVIVDLESGIFAMTVSDDGPLLALVNDGQTLPGIEIDTGIGHLIYKIT